MSGVNIIWVGTPALGCRGRRHIFPTKLNLAQVACSASIRARDLKFNAP